MIVVARSVISFVFFFGATRLNMMIGILGFHLPCPNVLARDGNHCCVGGFTTEGLHGTKDEASAYIRLSRIDEVCCLYKTVVLSPCFEYPERFLSDIGRK